MASNPAPDHWAEVERWYNAALEQPAGARRQFLADCRDPAIREEVTLLLRHDADADTFLERPAIEESATTLLLGHRPLSPGQRIGGYEIAAFIGAGGMGDVYRARDLRLERDVALKIVDRLSPTEAARFEEEARAASGLSHPNVVTIYGVGEDDAVAYIAMELVQGMTLRERLDESRPSVGDAFDLAVQLADALAAAHTAGIIHRDLKPDNVMVTRDGRVKVLDFGIARRGRHDDPEHGTIRGTAGYMSPEQANGEPTDHRTDQFALGAMLYEMFAGRRAFHRDTFEETLKAVRSTQPEPLQRLNAEVPPATRSLIERCLQKSPADRWRSTTDLAAECRRQRDRWLREEDIRRTRRLLWWTTGAAALVTAGGFTAWKLWPSGIRARSIAVLPFENADADPAVEYLCDGIAEHLMRRLSFLPDLNVRPRSAAVNFRGTTTGVTDAARRLHVDAVLAGSVRVKDGRLLVKARLVEASTNQTLWEDEYSKAATDALAVQEDLARAIVTEGIRHPVDANTKRQLDRPFTENADANDRYLRGIHQHRLGDEANYVQARQLLQEAVKLDPSFAIAHASLASTFSVMTIDGYERPTEAWPGADRAVHRALDLDADLPEAHSEQSSSWFFFDNDWPAAESAWKRAINARPSPTLPDLLGASAIKLWALGRTREALEVVRRARTLDPISATFALYEADLLLHDGQPRVAEAIYRSVLDSDSTNWRAWYGLSDAYRDQHRASEALAARRHTIDQSDSPPVGVSDERALLALERTEAERELHKLATQAAKGEYFSPLECARARARLGDRKGAFQDLDSALQEQSPGLVFLKVDRAWQSVRDDPRFTAVVELVGLP